MSDTLEIKKESLGSRALIIDDLFAVQAAALLAEKLSDEVAGLGGREKLHYPLFSLMTMNVCE